MNHDHLGHGAIGGTLDVFGLPAALFLAGLVGSLTHCSVMCGPFVLAQVAARLESATAVAGGELVRLAGAALVPYHLGRITTYTVLGAVAGAIAGQATALTGFDWLIAIFLALAALAFVAQAAQRVAQQVKGRLRRLMPGGGALGRWLGQRVGPLMRDPRGPRGYALGVALGFLPCGLLYGALAASAGAGSAVAGAIAMAAFTLGTVPALVGVGWLGAFFGRRWAPALRLVAAPVMLLNAGVLLWLAWRALA
jgi:sulfite exporter TauE/SafE